MVSFRELRAGECFLGGWLDALITGWVCFAAMMMSAFRANSGMFSSPNVASYTQTSSGNWRRKIRRKRLFRSTMIHWMYAPKTEGVQSPRPVSLRSRSAFWSTVMPYIPLIYSSSPRTYTVPVSVTHPQPYAQLQQNPKMWEDKNTGLWSWLCSASWIMLRSAETTRLVLPLKKWVAWGTQHG